MKNLKRFGGSGSGSETGEAEAKRIGCMKGGTTATAVAYPSLQEFRLWNLPNLETWLEENALLLFDDDRQGHQFPSLEELSLKGCPKLQMTPHLFPRLKSLDLTKGVNGLGVRSIITSRLTSLTSLSIKYNEDLIFLPERLLWHNTDLETLRIENCPKLQGFIGEDNNDDDDDDRKGAKEEEGTHGRGSGSVVLLKRNSLRVLWIHDCDALISMPSMMGFTSLQELSIGRCADLEVLPNQQQRQGGGGGGGGGGGNNNVGVGFLHFLPALEALVIVDCPKVNIGATTPSFLPLKSLSIFGDIVVHHLWTNWQLTALTSLRIERVPELKELPIEFLQNSTKHLQFLFINSCSMFQGFLNPWSSSENEQQQGQVPINASSSSLTALWINNCPSLLSLDLRGFIHCRELQIKGCRRFKSLKGLQFLTALEELCIGQFEEEVDYFPSLFEEDVEEENTNALTSLRYLEISWWCNLKSLPDQIQHLVTLHSLYIRWFDGLIALPEWLGRFTSLETLKIFACKNLKYLPSEKEIRRLTALQRLEIYECPFLKKRINKNREGERHKISHIPDFDII